MDKQTPTPEHLDHGVKPDEADATVFRSDINEMSISAASTPTDEIGKRR